MIVTKELYPINKKNLKSLEAIDSISFLNALEKYIIIINPDCHTIVFANNYAKKINPHLEGNLCWKALGYSKPCCSDKSCRDEKTFEAKRANDRWNEHQLTKMHLMDQTLIIEIIEDITERKMKEKEKSLKHTLISMVSHELRAPLNVILSTIQLLETFDDSWKDGKNFKHTQRIKKATSQINKLLRDILLVERVEADKVKFSPQPIDVVKLTKATIDLLKESDYYMADIIFTSTKEVFISKVDEFLLTTILTNLLTNALKYSINGEDVQIMLEFDDESMMFKIIDKGIGIPKVDQKNLFESFHRASNVGKIVGTGLGLTIVKDFIDIHKGSISFKSKENEGTTFIVKIPIVP
ncbi:Signal transduction histidine kinase [Natronincola peptidivorans]|uniref:histidine kinase n=1 Tax=Natronincola peptidivorans TaxID=426128 RepID=A0A1I0APS9_9FIRM|nr:HAMP domain-containing sensor histidine kinase [Natronincola peptidivorans]SES96388.1 Signal transduction histidine kinase [Natronincola peptidivorans]